jgi:hypothetical protein
MLLSASMARSSTILARSTFLVLSSTKARFVTYVAVRRNGSLGVHDAVISMARSFRMMLSWFMARSRTVLRSFSLARSFLWLLSPGVARSCDLVAVPDLGSLSDHVTVVDHGSLTGHVAVPDHWLASHLGFYLSLWLAPPLCCYRA